MDLTEPQVVDLQFIRDLRGNLTVIEKGKRVPFDIARAYWIYDVPSDAERDGHAMLSQTELIVALTGSFDVVTTTASGERRFHLDRNYRGLFVPPMTWREIENFSTASTALVVSSALFSEDDYVRSFEQYNEMIAQQL